MNLVLIGYRGTGKSAVAARLARSLGRPVMGLDAEIVRRAGKSIPEIVAAGGWKAFRDLESEVARDAAAGDGLIIDCGGGIIERPENVEALRRNGVVIWLKASVGVIVKRIEGGTERPALTAGKSFTDEVAEVLARRTPIYERSADAVVDTDDKTVAQVVEAVMDEWNRR